MSIASPFPLLRNLNFPIFFNFYRTCCFNYLKKRSSPAAAIDVQPKLWLSKSLLNKLIKMAQQEESDKFLVTQPLQNYNKYSESPPDDDGQV